MGFKIIRCKLNVAVLDIIDDTFGKIKDVLVRVGARTIGSSHGQRSSDKIDVPFHGTIFAFDLEANRSKVVLDSDLGKML